MLRVVESLHKKGKISDYTLVMFYAKKTVALWFALVGCIQQVGFGAAQEYDCETNFDKAEQCFQQLMMIGSSIQWTKESFQAVCSAEFDAISCIQEYKQKCIKGVASMVFNLLSKKFNSTFNHLCSDNDAMDGNLVSSSSSFTIWR